MLLEKGEFLKAREYEGHILKSDRAYYPKQAFRITHISSSKQDNGAELLLNEGKVPLIEGTLLGVDELIVTNSSTVELRDNNGILFRLGQNSEFALELTAEGIAPVYYGEIYKTRLSSMEPAMCGKYRTSCYLRCTNTVFAKNVSKDLDVFYSLSENAPIWEYDERGRKFHIVTIDEGYKATLRYSEGKPMKERYIVEDLSPISDDEYDYITMNFMNPKNWK